jgi:hypothetical protein
MAFAFQPMFRRRPSLNEGVSPHFSKAKNGDRPRPLLVAAMLAGMVLAGVPGCSLILPDVSHEPVVHNPFPQLNKVAVAPFFNLSNEPTVDGRKFALAYFAELQAVPGFEVVPLGVVENAIIENRVNLSNPDEARRLANILGVDAVVIGSVTDYTPYYPPRCGLRVEWYAANPGFHEIPPGYGLPWGTPEEEYIPAPLVFESEFALAKAQLKTQTPLCEKPPLGPPASADDAQQTEPQALPNNMPLPPPAKGSPQGTDGNPNAPNAPAPNAPPAKSTTNNKAAHENAHATRAVYEEQVASEELPPGHSQGDSTANSAGAPLESESAAAGGMIVPTGAYGALPPNWPDERGFIPPPPSPTRPACCPHNGPVMTHTRIYSGNDSEFTEALASYYHFRDDARFGGWQNYLQRSDDFIRFCCHMHISEMLSARGGAGETRVVWQWSDCR